MKKQNSTEVTKNNIYVGKDYSLIGNSKVLTF